MAAGRLLVLPPGGQCGTPPQELSQIQNARLFGKNTETVLFLFYKKITYLGANDFKLTDPSATSLGHVLVSRDTIQFSAG